MNTVHAFAHLTRIALAAALLVVLAAPAAASNDAAQPPPAFPGGKFTLQKNDVVVFLGGEAVVQEAESGHFESILAVQFPGMGIRYRNMAWEGDTVFEQPRDVNWPPLGDQLKRVGATVAFMQFGRMESLAGRDGVPAFVAAYEKLCDEVAKHAPRIVLVTPLPFEWSKDPRLPDLSARNGDLRLYAEATAALAKRRGYPCVDLFTTFQGEGPDEGEDERAIPLTSDGLHLSPFGLSVAAMEAGRALGLEHALGVACGAGTPAWPGTNMEELRKAIVEKNRLWFDYWRPMNWAFLGGDRMFVLASRDHNDPNVRWFPDEMEKFVPLIAGAEARVEELAKPLGPRADGGDKDERK